MSVLPPQCWLRECVHLQEPKQTEPGEDNTTQFTCPAFPDGIPQDILYGDNPHLLHDPRQVGTVVYTRS